MHRARQLDAGGAQLVEGGLGDAGGERQEHPGGEALVDGVQRGRRTQRPVAVSTTSTASTPRSRSHCASGTPSELPSKPEYAAVW
ncbi:hypothetical protein [Geodermatophilus sp. TF02-6]|uniref:hypothetical protein n=1 Tax=Geodermatophilus sp. TF02-6 TaxID=2250575 RepID=UPI00272E2304|nr:hypothetical protein [Geodermatophilus sp. TF02-6]